MLARRPYSTDLSDEEWRILEPLVPEAMPGGCPRAHEARELLDAVFYVVRGGCAWRLLPQEFPPWKTVYHYQPFAALYVLVLAVLGPLLTKESERVFGVLSGAFGRSKEAS